jgi:hypothetical protein
LDDPCETLTEYQNAIVSNFTLNRCEDIAKVKFDGYISAIADARGQDYSFYPYMFKGSYKITFNVFTMSFSGIIPDTADANTSSNYMFKESNKIYYDINTNKWTGLIPSVFDGRLQSNYIFNESYRIYSYVKCPSWSSNREGNTCYKSFSEF